MIRRGFAGRCLTIKMPPLVCWISKAFVGACVATGCAVRGVHVWTLPPDTSSMGVGFGMIIRPDAPLSGVQMFRLNVANLLSDGSEFHCDVGWEYSPILWVLSHQTSLA